MRPFFFLLLFLFRYIPENAYDNNATILIGTKTILAANAPIAHPNEYYSLRYVNAGAEKKQDETRRIRAEKFGLRVFEGYGTPEPAPVIAANTPMD